MASAMVPAKAASPSMMGTMACTPGRIANPAAVICSRKYKVLASRRSRNSVVSDSISKALMAAPTMAGATVFENK